jgi:hypothetical protein
MIITSLITLTGIFGARKDCNTNFKVIDCDKQPIAGATVRVTRCSDGKIFTESTNAKGETEFPLCQDSVCHVSVTLVGFTPTELPKKGYHCKGDVCTIKICPRS